MGKSESKLRPTYHRIDGVKPRGTPRIYAEELCQDLIDKMAEGLFVVEICAEWGISETTFGRWRDKYPEFEEAYKIAKTAGKAQQVKKFKLMESGAIEGKHSFNAAKLLAANEYGMTSGDVEKNSTTTINVYNTMSEQQLLEVYEQKQKLLQRLVPKDINVIDVTPEDKSNGNE